MKREPEDKKKTPEDMKREPEDKKKEPEDIKKEPEDKKKEQEDIKKEPEDKKKEPEDNIDPAVRTRKEGCKIFYWKSWTACWPALQLPTRQRTLTPWSVLVI